MEDREEGEHLGTGRQLGLRWYRPDCASRNEAVTVLEAVTRLQDPSKE